MKTIHFIVNPIAGSGQNELTFETIQSHFSIEEYAITIKISKYKKHATQLTNESIVEGAQIIVACGGDGTINEIASSLVGTPVILGIIPLGSGNGLASDLKISKNVEEAMTTIKNEIIKKIDVGRLHEHFFFSNAGVGFDASVVKNYEASKRRKLFSYINASIKSFKELNYKNKISLHSNGKTIISQPLMIFISNTNELGYKVSLTPKASLQDGLLDVVIILKINKLKILLLGFLMLLKRHHQLTEVNTFQTKELELTRHLGSTFQAQIDGELHSIENKIIKVAILENALSVIA